MLLPEFNEIVIVKATKILDYGVMVELLEYPGVEGFVHISHVSSGWVKSIRNFVREEQIRAASVLGVDSAKNQVEVSFKKVSAEEERVRIEQWKQFKRAKMLIEIIANARKQPFDTVWKAVAEPLIEEYGSLADSFQEIAVKKESALKSIAAEWRAIVLETISKNIVIPIRTLQASVAIKSLEPNGVNDIKNCFQTAVKKSNAPGLTISYLGAGKFRIQVTSYDYKLADHSLKEFRETLTRELERHRAVVEFAKA